MEDKIRWSMSYANKKADIYMNQIGFIDICRESNSANVCFLNKDEETIERFKTEIIEVVVNNDATFIEYHQGEYNFSFRRSFNVRNFLSLMKEKNYNFDIWIFQ